MPGDWVLTFPWGSAPSWMPKAGELKSRESWTGGTRRQNFEERNPEERRLRDVSGCMQDHGGELSSSELSASQHISSLFACFHFFNAFSLAHDPSVVTQQGSLCNVTPLELQGNSLTPLRPSSLVLLLFNHFYHCRHDYDLPALHPKVPGARYSLKTQDQKQCKPTCNPKSTVRPILKTWHLQCSKSCVFSILCNNNNNNK